MKNFNTADLPNAHLYGLLTDEINETFWGDLKFIKTLRLVAQSAEAANLRKECDDHAWQIEEQLVKFRKAAVIAGVDIEARENHIMSALLKDTHDALEKYRDTETLDRS